MFTGRATKPISVERIFLKTFLQSYMKRHKEHPHAIQQFVILTKCCLMGLNPQHSAQLKMVWQPLKTNSAIDAVTLL